MSRPEPVPLRCISATHNNKTHFTRNASSMYGAFFVFKEVTNTMKKNLFKRGMAGLLSLVMCLTALVGIGTTTAYAAGERAEVYLVSFPRSGDANIDYSGTWGHPNLRYMNGWHSGESKYTTIRRQRSSSAPQLLWRCTMFCVIRLRPAIPPICRCSIPLRDCPQWASLCAALSDSRKRKRRIVTNGT